MAETYWLKDGKIAVDSNGKWIKCSSCPCRCAVVKKVSYTSTTVDVCEESVRAYNYTISLKEVDLPYTLKSGETFVAGVDGKPAHSCGGSYSEVIKYKTYQGSGGTFDIRSVYQPEGETAKISEVFGYTSLGRYTPSNRYSLEDPIKCSIWADGRPNEEYVLLKASSGYSKVAVEFTLYRDMNGEEYTEIATIGNSWMSPLYCDNNNGAESLDLVGGTRVVCKPIETENSKTLRIGQSLTFTGTLI